MQPPLDDEGYLPAIYQTFRVDHPDIMRAYSELAEACRTAGGLSRREQRLTKLGIAVGLGSEGGVRSHVRRGLQEGISPADLTHAVLLAVPTAGFPATTAAYQWAHEVLDAGGDEGR